MAHWQYPELIADAVIAYIEANQAAKMTGVAAAYTANPLDMPVFAAVRLLEPYREAEPDFPVLYVMPVEDEQEPGDGGIERGFWTTHRFEFAALVAFYGAADMSPNEGARRLGMRYLGALEEMLAESFDPATRPYEWGVGDAPRRAYGPIYTNQAGEWLHDCRLIISCRAKEAAL